jgi:ABC-type nickel/cobalt efflux system permease component RcnA
VAAVLTLVADAGSSRPRISIRDYYLILAGVYVVSIGAFCYVRGKMQRAPDYQRLVDPKPSVEEGAPDHPPPHHEHDHEAPPSDAGPAGRHGGYGSVNQATVVEDHGHGHGNGRGEEHAQGEGHSHAHAHAHVHGEAQGEAAPKSRSSPRVVLLVQFLLSSLAFGVMPSILPIACAGYIDSSRVLMTAAVM